MAGSGWGSRVASHRAPQSWLFPGRFLGRPYVANSTELHRFRRRNASRTLDYAVVDDTIVGRIYREMILGKPKRR
jgi:hypothetical protein